jgi:uncharacterized membrane protein (UPF0127 family)
VRGLGSILVVALALCACRSEGGAPPARRPAPPVVQGDVTAEDYEMPALPRARVVLTDAYGGKHPVDSEVAATPEARTRGLMWRTQLAAGAGMLFIFPRQQPLTFWMKNTLIPLDMIFFDEALTIVGIEESAVPRTLSSRGPGAPAKYVLEVPGGWSARVGLRPGLKVELLGVADLAVR